MNINDFGHSPRSLINVFSKISITLLTFALVLQYVFLKLGH